MNSMTSYKQIEVQFEEPNPKKWCVLLKEDVFVTLMNKGNFITHKVLCEGSLFSPLLFGKFFDPSDAFPLWEFDSDVLLSNARSSNNQCTVDWAQTDTDYVLRAEIPGVGKAGIRVSVEDGKVLEVSGQLRLKIETGTKGRKVESGRTRFCVRRIELKMRYGRKEAFLSGDHKFLEVKIPKIPPNISDVP
ncbi:21.7 kDa class VI heat shock protein [Lycium ferocissimum]|uniref:21.7 kDa class VI heat shock protein n=1 Tax=Lycium ferocissimum TaxID=112874 RepID=UPI0028169692|nr:21.7 kDa class VI heat shock protein [Lycium ferocissimum]